MIKCVNSKCLPEAHTFDDLLAQTARLGFAGLELTFNAKLEPEPQICGVTFPAALAKTQKNNLQICSITTDRFDLFHLASSDRHLRTEAREYFKKLIKLWLDSSRGGTVVIPAHQVNPLGSLPVDSYESAFNHLFDSLLTLTAQAQKQSLNLALETPGSGLLLSPLELRELIDQINSPYLGLCLNPHYLAQIGNPLDWLNLLERRILMLHLPVRQLPENHLKKYQTILDSLVQKNFSIPIVYSIQSTSLIA